MFFERIGKFFFLTTRPFFFFVLILLPLLGSTFYLLSELSQIQDLEDRFRSAARKSRLCSQKKQRKEHFLARYSNPDPYFLDREIESLLFLQNEKKRLLSLLQHPAFTGSQLIQDRLKEIKENTLSFIEKNMTSSSLLKETEEHLRHSVQMDEGDLKKILYIIEDLSEEETLRPQLLIQDFFLRKIRSSLQEEVFEVEMDLLKREFTP